MDKISSSTTAGAGLAGMAVGTINEKKINFLDIDIAFGALPFNLPLSNMIVIVGFLLTVYAALDTYKQKKERKRRREDI